VIALSPRFFSEEIRRTPEVFAEQSAKIRQIMESTPQHLLQFDAFLGWRYRAGYKDPRNEMNQQGLRSTRAYAPTPSPGVLRIAAFGDSFVYGNEVANAESWPFLIEEMFPRLEVLNYGVGGYGTDQAYLRFLMEGAALAPDIVLIGFAPVDLARTVNVYRRFLSNLELPLIKPRFVLDRDGRLSLLSNPITQVTDYGKYLEDPRGVIELGRDDYWYESVVYENPLYDLSATVRVLTTLWVRVRRRYLDGERLLEGDGVVQAVKFKSESPAFRIQTMLFEKFKADALALRAVPIVVILPDGESVTHARLGRQKIFDPLLEHLRKSAVAYIDLSDAFAAEAKTTPQGRWFMPGGHYSGAGNKMIAAWLAHQVEERVKADCLSRPENRLRACRALNTF